MNGRMRADQQAAAVVDVGPRENADIEGEAVELARQIDEMRQQAEDLRVEIEMAVSALSTTVTNLSAVATGAVMQLHGVKERLKLLDQRKTAEPEVVAERAGEEAVPDLASRVSRNGDLFRYPKQPTLAERLDNYTVTGSGCHEWNGPRNLDGFGMMTVLLPVGKRQRTVHRLAWKVARGEIPHGMQVRHTCGNRACINVEHLELAQDKRGRRPSAEALRRLGR